MIARPFALAALVAGSAMHAPSAQAEGTAARAAALEAREATFASLRAELARVMRPGFMAELADAERLLLGTRADLGPAVSSEYRAMAHLFRSILVDHGKGLTAAERGAVAASFRHYETTANSLYGPGDDGFDEWRRAHPIAFFSLSGDRNLGTFGPGDEGPGRALYGQLYPLLPGQSLVLRTWESRTDRDRRLGAVRVVGGGLTVRRTRLASAIDPESGELWETRLTLRKPPSNDSISVEVRPRGFRGWLEWVLGLAPSNGNSRWTRFRFFVGDAVATAARGESGGGSNVARRAPTAVTGTTGGEPATGGEAGRRR